MLELIGDVSAYLPNLWPLLPIIGTAILLVATPFGKAIVERWFARRPAFFLQSATFSRETALKIRPANKSAKKRRRLGLKFRGQNLPDVAQYKMVGKEIEWTFDLSKSAISDILEENQNYDIQLFFDPGNPSEPITLRFVGARYGLFATTTETEPSQRVCRTSSQLVNGILSNTNITIDAETDILVSRAFPSTTSNADWTNVHDGKELTISFLSDFSLTNGRILAEARYGWVFSFNNCSSLAFRNVTIGHTLEGYCMGGVLRFRNCSDIIIEQCDLFGCGTYGIELIDCKNVEIVDSTIRDCSYGAIRIHGSDGVVFRNCIVSGNRGFDLIGIDGELGVATFQSCTFKHNEGDGFMFNLKGRETGYGLFIWDSTFSNNLYNAVGSERVHVDERRNTFM